MGKRKRHTPDEVIAKLRDAGRLLSEAKPVFRIGEKDGTSENPNDSAWDSTKRVVSFWMKGECASMNVQVSASTGAKYVQYLFGTGTNGALSGGNAKVYLGYAAPEDWVRFERNVEADFEAYAGGGATWNNTDGLYISWPKSLLSYAFYVDDIRLSDSLTVEHNTLGPGVIGHILRHTTWDATTLAKTDRWFHYDQVGSVLNESDANGDDVTRHEQDAFGNVMLTWSGGLWDGGASGWGFQTKERGSNESAMSFYHRWFIANLGAFSSLSPLPVYAEERYAFAHHNAVHLIDPTGRKYHPIGQALRTSPVVNNCPSKSPRNTDPKWSVGGTLDTPFGTYVLQGSGDFQGSNGISYCSEGTSSFHPGAKECFRQIVPLGATNCGGSQCCYDSSGDLIRSGPGAGTYDFVAPATGSWLDGECQNNIGRVIRHFRDDVVPFYIGGL